MYNYSTAITVQNKPWKIANIIYRVFYNIWIIFGLLFASFFLFLKGVNYNGEMKVTWTKIGIGFLVFAFGIVLSKLYDYADKREDRKKYLVVASFFTVPIICPILYALAKYTEGNSTSLISKKVASANLDGDHKFIVEVTRKRKHSELTEGKGVSNIYSIIEKVFDGGASSVSIDGEKFATEKKAKKFQFVEGQKYSVTAIFDVEDVSDQNVVFDKVENSMKLSDGFITLVNAEEKKVNKFKLKSAKRGKTSLADLPPLSFSGLLGLIGSYAGIIAWTVLIITPLFYVFRSAFDANAGVYLQTGADFVFTLDNFKQIFAHENYMSWMQTTIIVAGATALLTTIFVSLIGYAYSRYKFTGRRKTLFAVMMVQTIPSFVAMVVFIVFNEMFLDMLPVWKPHFTLILIYTGGAIAGNVFLLKGYLDSISMELDDSGRIDGCSNIQLYRKIIMPIAKPMLALIFMWSFIGPFFDFLLPSLLIRSEKTTTIAAGLRTFITGNPATNMNYSEINFVAGSLIIAVPITILFIVLQKFLVEGLQKGSVKG